MSLLSYRLFHRRTLTFFGFKNKPIITKLFGNCLLGFTTVGYGVFDLLGHNLSVNLNSPEN